MDQVEAYLSNVTNQRSVGVDNDYKPEGSGEDHVVLQIKAVKANSKRNSLESLEEIPDDLDQTESTDTSGEDNFIQWMPENRMILNNPNTLLSRPLPKIIGEGRFTRSISSASNESQELSKGNIFPSHRTYGGNKGSFSSSLSISPPVSPMYIPVYGSSTISSPRYSNNFHQQQPSNSTMTLWVAF